MKRVASGMGALLGAFGMSLCCLAPLVFPVVFPLLGLSVFSSLWLLRTVVPYRPWFFLATIVFLGVGFYMNYRPGAPSGRINRAVLWASTALVVASVGYSASIEGQYFFLSLVPFR